MSSMHQDKVHQFMDLARQARLPMPGEPTGSAKLLTARLLLEEALETIQKGLGISVWAHTPDGKSELNLSRCSFEVVRPFDLVETVDGCCDIRHASTFLLSTCGVDDEIQNVVDDSNLTKFGPGSGKDPVTGKWQKPPDWQPPAIAVAVAAQAARRLVE